MNAFSETEHDLEPERVAEMLESGEADLIDVREPYEWEAGHLKQARHIELEYLASQARDIDRDRPVIFQCRLGIRSALATEAFRADGYDAYNMAGGLVAWAERGLPLEPEDGHVAEHHVGSS